MFDNGHCMRKGVCVHTETGVGGIGEIAALVGVNGSITAHPKKKNNEKKKQKMNKNCNKI